MPSPSNNNPSNPIRTYRDDYKLSQKDLARLAGITEQVVLKAEQGMYPTIPPALLWAIINLSGAASLYVKLQYEEWIVDELHKVSLPVGSDQMIHDIVLFKDWKTAVCALNSVPDSVNQFCKLFKINPYVINKYISGKMKGVPVQLIERIATIRGVW